MPDYIPYRRHKIIVLAARVLINFDLEDFGPFQLNGWLLHIDQLANLLIFRTNVAGIFRFFLIQNDLSNHRFDAMLQNINNFGFCCRSLVSVCYLGNDDLNGVTIDSVINIISANKEVLFFAF